MQSRRSRPNAKACHSCRRRKVRCQYDRGMTKCRACFRRSSSCIASSIPNLIGSQPATHPQINHTPAALDPFGAVFDGLSTPGPSTPPFLTDNAHQDTALPPLLHHLSSVFDPAPPDTDPFASLLCFSLPRSLVNRPNSSPLSLFSPEGNEWLREAVGNEMLNSDLLAPSIFDADPIFGRSSCAQPAQPQQFIHLPPKDIARSLLNTYFERCNSFCPTFEEHEFMLWFELEYPIGPESSAAWACLNATLALACLLDPHSQSKAWLFWKNAALSWESFMTHAPSLCSAQALLTMTLYLLGTFHDNPSSTMVPMTIRMLSGIPRPQEGVSHQFLFVRLVAQALDIDHALQVGVPPTELGAMDHSLNPVFPDSYEDSSIPFDCYPAFCRLLKLKEEIYRQLYSVSAQCKSDYEAIAATGQLDSRLEQWRSDIPERYQPGHPKATDAIKQGVSDAVLHLHLSYYNCVLVIHRRSIALAKLPSTSKPPDLTTHVAPAPRSSNPRALMSAQLCAEAARSSLRLVKFIPKDNPMTRGVMLHYVVFALKLLVTITVQDPSSPRARADILLMRNLEDVLSAIRAGHEERSTRNLIEYCTRHRDIAEQAINDVLSRKGPKPYDQPRKGHTSQHVF
ncbi:hypothetical protein BJX64DRAFT_278179 [Aspergillus heterothallicus]